MHLRIDLRLWGRRNGHKDTVVSRRVLIVNILKYTVSCFPARVTYSEQTSSLSQLTQLEQNHRQEAICPRESLKLSKMSVQKRLSRYALTLHPMSRMPSKSSPLNILQCSESAGFFNQCEYLCNLVILLIFQRQQTVTGRARRRIGSKMARTMPLGPLPATRSRQVSRGEPVRKETVLGFASGILCFPTGFLFFSRRISLRPCPNGCSFLYIMLKYFTECMMSSGSVSWDTATLSPSPAVLSSNAAYSASRSWILSSFFGAKRLSNAPLNFRNIAGFVNFLLREKSHAKPYSL
ncbi:hypothetical protein V1504DRAFT_333285 [Lipomyces starkeyi]